MTNQNTRNSMANGNGSVTNRDLYDAVNSLRGELSGSIQRLDDRFTALESGRITRLEEEVTKQKVAGATAATKLAIIGFIAASIIGALITTLAPRAIH